MTQGFMSFMCPRCQNPLTLSFPVAPDEDVDEHRQAHCPGCGTFYTIGVKITGESRK